MADDWIRRVEHEANLAARKARMKKLQREHAKAKAEDRRVNLWWEALDRERTKGSGQKDFFRKEDQ